MTVRLGLRLPVLISILLQSTVLANDFEILSINLVGWEGCSNSQRAKISQGWEGAIKMAGALQGDVMFNEAAAVEYLGPPVHTEVYQDQYREIFRQASTFGQGSKWTPTPLKWKVYVRCDDWRNTCGSTAGTEAYTKNVVGEIRNAREPKSDAEHIASTPVINFCDGYFQAPSFQERVASRKNEANYIKYNLDWYRDNRDYMMFHELMHCDSVTYSRNGNKPIYDLRFGIEEQDRLIKAYGASKTKLFAMFEDSFIGDYVTRNADNYAQYALAKAVQKALGDVYPHLPHAFRGTIENREPHRIPTVLEVQDDHLIWTPNVEDIIFNSGGSSSDNDCSDGLCGPTFKLTGIISDTQYPTEYLEQKAAWLEEFKDVEPVNLPYAGPSLELQNPSQICNFDPVYVVPVSPVTTTIAKMKIDEVCKLFKDISLNDSSQKEVIMPYEVINVEMHMWAAWNSGDPTCIERGSNTITEEHCVDMFNQLVNGCPSDDDLKTYGGSKVDSCIVYGFDIEKLMGQDPIGGRRLV